MKYKNLILSFALVFCANLAAETPPDGVRVSDANQSETHQAGFVTLYNPVLGKVQIDGVMYTITKETRKGEVVVWPGKVYNEGEVNLGEGAEVIFSYQKAQGRPLNDIFGVRK